MELVSDEDCDITINVVVTLQMFVAAQSLNFLIRMANRNHVTSMPMVIMVMMIVVKFIETPNQE